MPIDYEKLLRAYINRVLMCEGTTFLEPGYYDDMGVDDLSEEERKRLVEIGEEEAASY